MTYDEVKNKVVELNKSLSVAVARKRVLKDSMKILNKELGFWRSSDGLKISSDLFDTELMTVDGEISSIINEIRNLEIDYDPR